MRIRSAWLMCGVAVSVLSLVLTTSAAKVVLNIKVVNPSDQPQTKEIIQPLPRGLGTSDIISLDGMELRYESATTSYCVRAEQTLGPKQSVSFEVEVNDVWSIPSGALSQIEEHARKLGRSLKGTAHAARGAELEAAVTNGLARIAASQAVNEASRVGAERHIEAFARDSRMLAGIKALAAEMEDLVSGTGQDPGRLTFPGTPAGGAIEAGEQKGIASFRIVVVNFATNETRSVRVLQYLPPEVGTADIVDAAGLEVRSDPVKGACYLVKEGVELKPGASATFNVAIRDRWNVNGNRVERLKQRLMVAWGKCRALKHYKSIEPQIAGVVDTLKMIDEDRGPETLDQRYIDFFKSQSRSLDIIEEYIARIERLAPGSDGRPPARYAWIAIYTVVIFLAVFGLVAYLRVSKK